MIDGRIIESTAKAPYELFVEKELIKIDSSAITVTDAFHHYFTFCRLNTLAPLSRQEFASLAAEVVRVAFGCGVRRDVRGRNGKQTAGWVGLGLRVPEASVMGLSCTTPTSLRTTAEADSAAKLSLEDLIDTITVNCE